MGLKVIKRKSAILLAFIMTVCVFANAADESYIQTLSGKVKKGDSCTVVDDKFLNLSLADWNQIRNVSVDNIISFDLRNDTNFYYYNRIFTCTIKLSIKYFTSRDQQSPDIIDSVSLSVRYDSTTASYYPVSSSYRFKNAFKVTVVVDSIFSQEWGSNLPDIFRIRNQILISRVYPFNPQINAGFHMGLNEENGQTNRVQIQGANRKIVIDWDPSLFGGSEQIDLEWTFIDKMSARGDQVATYSAGGGFFDIPQNKLEEWMRYDNTRVSIVPTASYTISQHYPEGYIIARIRGVSTNTDGVRVTSNWIYTDGTHTECVEILSDDAHESNLNWQYNGSFAEEGKSKEVMSYFDATLRSRQIVTINNSDNIAVAAETIYDNMGRPSLSILPSPINDNKLQYYTGLNLNMAGQSYSHTDITQDGGSCYPEAGKLRNDSKGAGKYYSPNNSFLSDNNFYFTKYVPDAKERPFALTQYMDDNTGRVRSQGGLGEDFQPGTNHETKYFYGKPLQSELDRIFGMEVGYNSHYLKNMIVDANGQVSVSYVDASGKTIATALAGIAPGNLDELPSAVADQDRKSMNQVLMRPTDFIRDAATLTKKSVATFLAAVPNAQYKVSYVINPASLGPYNGPNVGQQFCTNCAYEVVVSVKDDCGNVIVSRTSAAFAGSIFSCGTAAEIVDELEFIAPKIGEYTITYSLQLSREVINTQVEFYIKNNIDLKQLQDFFHDEMLTVNLKGCYSDCNTCQQKLGTEEQFTQKMHQLLEQLKVEKYSGYNFNTNSTEIQEWIHSTYLELVANCNSLAANCIPLSPCEKNLEMMKNDVRPFGQYALVDYDEPTDVYSIHSDVTSLLALYHTVPASNDPDAQDIYNISFTDDNGNNVLARNLSVSDFIKAYLNHPEWADKFVKKHVEYCSYLWCAYRYKKPEPEGTTIEASYMFDEKIREQATTGQRAIDMGYFDPAQFNKIIDPANPNSDPFFRSDGAGREYAGDMASDLAYLSDVLGMTPSDALGNPQPVKNILQLTDWLLYCMPSQANPTVADYVNSWNNCNPSSSCRSLTEEWEIYRGYYLQLKSKYMAILKHAKNPDCTNCYIGTDGLGDNVQLSDCTPLPSLPASYCTGNEAYRAKTRIWDNYVNMQSYANCMGSNGSTTGSDALQQFVVEAKDNVKAMSAVYFSGNIVSPDPDNLENIDGAWISRLRSVIAEENELDINNGITPRFSSLSDVIVNGVAEANPILRNLVAKLKEIAIKNIDHQASLSNPNPSLIRGTSVLPPGITTTSGYNNFLEAFNSIIGTTLVSKGFGPDLLDQPYPYNKNVITLNPATDKLSTDICTSLQTMYLRYQTVTGGNTVNGFHNFLKQELMDDYILTEAQLQQLMDRCTGNCRWLEEPLLLPAVFSSPNPANPDHPWVNCERVATLHSQFNLLYPNVVPDTKLFEVLFSNYLNHQLGYALSYHEYKDFEASCVGSPNKVLYNKPASPQLTIDDWLCERNIMAGVFERAGQEYIAYIERERVRFRNELISKCLNNTTSARLEGDQYEYHYILYYYDQSGNLVKTIPPEGVAFLSDNEIELVEDFRDSEAVCTGVGVPNSENVNQTFTVFSTALQNNDVHATEMWLYSGTSGTTRQVRVITPDHRYFYQVAIKDDKLWVELFSLLKSGSANEELNITLSNHAVADLSSLPPLQAWTHLFIQSSGTLTGGALQLYLDGRKLTNMTGMVPGYPFDWEINSTTGSYILPAQDLSALKHFRTYDAIASDGQVWANYKNSCLSPVGHLDINGNNAYVIWGRFNIPAPGTVTTTGPGSTTEYINRFIVPDHGLPTNYAYNSLNQVIKQNSPDGGTSEFWYDSLGRLAVSQNAEQKQPTVVNEENPSNRYSYTRYDVLGRITEVGEKINATTNMTEDLARSSGLANWLTNVSNGSKRQITFTAYDEAPFWIPISLAGLQHNLRKRVVATALVSASPNSGLGAFTAFIGSRVSASYYSYDLIGNVNTLVQENKAMTTAENGSDGLKTIKYEYDLISGKVNKVLYQHNKWDQFYYQYLYDAENRLVSAWSSRTNLGTPSDGNTEWVKESTYRYYLHGPLARMELGRNKVQGVDYAYTLQGWLKGINSQFLSSDRDMSNDGLPGSNFPNHARDVYGFSLGYYDGDYTPIGATAANAFDLGYTRPTADPDNRNSETGKELFNGNISYGTYAMGPINNGGTAVYTYRYDQLNRLTGMRRNNVGSDETGWTNSSIIEAYKEEISYDANGNIKTYLRNGANNGNMPLAMDNLSYGYTVDNNGKLVNNKLRHVKDDVPAGNYSQATNGTDDIDAQADDNYLYDNIGNLIKDNAENIQRINWTVYGKIASITKGSTTISYTYDASGNRISKALNVNGVVNTTYYVRDAQGTVLGVYEATVGNYTWKEQHLYGSSRLGMLMPEIVYQGTQTYPYTSTNIDPANSGIIGKRRYELSNHLGNVLVTISDRKIGVTQGTGPIFYQAEVITANDYYPFGMLMPGRKYSATGSYRYGFNGKENDNDVKGEGNQQDYGMRIYDPRVGRFLSVDPISNSYPELTPYQYASNRPIDGIDLDGLEYYKTGTAKVSPSIWYDDEQKRITTITAHIVYANVANGLKMKLHSLYKLPGAWNDPDIHVGTPVSQFVVPIKAPDSDASKTALDDTNQDVGADKFQYNITGKRSALKGPTFGSNKSSRERQRINSKTLTITQNVEFDMVSNKLTRGMAWISLIGDGLKLGYDIYEKYWEIPKINKQGDQLVANLNNLMNLALKNNLIPKNNLCTSDLTQIAEYLADGTLPIRTNAVGTKEINTELLNVAKSIWELSESEKRKEAAKVISQEVKNQNSSTISKDNTSVQQTPRLP